nr:MAG TPA: hypothetical protein [Bacteriophage sp.]
MFFRQYCYFLSDFIYFYLLTAPKLHHFLRNCTS